MVAVARTALPLLRGSVEGADCPNCPFNINGRAARPVCSEHPQNPAWIVIGEGPGTMEVSMNRPFIGPSGEIVNKILAKVGRPREEIFVGNATLCQPPRNSPDHLRDLAANACRPRLQRELAQWPGIPVLTFGAVAARSLIPQATLDAIDPPTVPKSKKKSQKARQRAEAKAIAKTTKARITAIDKLAKARLKALVALRHEQLVAELTRPLPSAPYRKRKRPTKALINQLMEEQRELPKLKAKADADAIVEYELGAKERELQAAYAIAHPKPPKPPKPKKVKITDIMGTCFDVDIDGSGLRPLIPTLHPAALLRGGGATIGGTHTPDLAFVNMIYDAGKVNAIADGKDIRLHLNIETEINDSERTWQLLRDVLCEALELGEVAIDLETYVEDPERHHALMAYMARIRTIGLATENRAVSIMWDLIPPWALSYLQLVLTHPRVKTIYHNAIYDRTVLRANGFTVEGEFDCTLLQHHAAFPGSPHRLQVVTSQFFAVEPWKSEYRGNEETPENLTRYNAKDTGATQALSPQLTVMVKKTKTEKIYALDKKMAEIASKMHLVGMPVSREVNSELLSTFTKNVVESRRAVEEIAEDPKNREGVWHYLALQQAQKKRKKDPDMLELPDGKVVDGLEARYHQRLREMRLDSDWKWKIGGGKHISALLQALGVPLHQVTATGQISTKKDVLEALVNVPVVRDILTFRENDKLLSTFVRPIFDRYDHDGDLIQYGFADDNDRIHPIWTVHAISGRWRAGEPNCQNVPKAKFQRMPDGTKRIVRPNLRRQVVAPKGRKLVGFDFAQIEARVIALVSGDAFLCETFANGQDIHTSCARVIFSKFDGMPKDDQKQAREVTKNVEYGSFYGGAPETCWKALLKQGYDLKLVDVTRAIGTLMAKMSGVVAWQRNVVARASQPPFEIRDFVLGRRRTFPLGQVEASEAMNAEIQPSAAAIMNLGMARADDGLKAYREAFPIIQVHDATVFECDEDDAEKIAADIPRWFEQSYERNGRTIPFPVEVRIADSWADV